MTTPPIYLDYNATAPLLPEAKQAMEALPLLPYNPSSIHQFGRTARLYREQARQSVAQSAGIESLPSFGKCIFTSSGTEANNLALRGLPNHQVFVSAIEHPSVLEMTKYGATTLPVTAAGIIDLEQLEATLASVEGPTVISVMLANNETGLIQPIEDITRITHVHGALVHCDAVQALGRIPLDVDALGVDMLTLSSHKCGGPAGAAALLVRDHVPLEPILHGGGQELRLRPGTENIMALVGFGVAAKHASENYEKLATHTQHLQTLLEDELTQFAGEDIIIARNSARLPNTSAIAMPDVHYETQLIQLDLAGIAVSAGSACSSGKITPSHVLTAMGIAPEQASSVIRISTGANTTENEVRQFIDAWKTLYQRNHLQKTGT